MAARSAVFVTVVATTAVFLSASSARAQSDGAVHGQVVAALDRSAVAGTILTLTSVSTAESVETAADANGHFVFPSVRAGRYTLTATSAGFQSRRITIVVEPREIRALAIALDVAPLDVRVSVTADVALPSTHSPSSTLLTTERLDSLSVFQRETLPDAVVTAAPGMIRGHDDFVHIRGHEVALNPLINGVSFWENTHAVFSPGLSPDVIETANVMTGGFPAEYGNRFGGVVDIVTKSGLRMAQRGSATFSLGDLARVRGAGEAGGARDSIGYYVFGSMFATDRFFSPPDREVFHDSARGGHVFTALDSALSRRGAFRGVLTVDGVNAEIPKTAADMTLRPDANATQRSRQQTAIFGWTKASSNLMMAASGYERWSRLRLLPAAGPLTATADVSRELLTLGAKADVTRVSGRHAFKTGLDVVWLAPEESLAYNYAGYRALTHLLGLPHIHVTGQQIAFNGRESGVQVSAFAQDSMRFGSRLTADVGARIDRYSLVVSQTHVSPRVNLAVQAAKDTLLHASYNHFFVPPPIEGILSSSAGLTRGIVEIGGPLPALRATTEDQFEAGLTMSPGAVEIGLTGYYRNTDNPVHTTVWPDSRIYSYASFDRGRAYGLEVRADASGWAKYGVTGYANYALGRVYFYNPVTGGFLTEAAHLTDTNRFLAPMDQTHTLTAGGLYRHAQSGAWLSAGIEYGSGTPIGHGAAHEHGAGESDHEDAEEAEAAERIPAHFTGNLAVGVDLLRDRNGRSKLTLRLDAENVANEAYVIARESAFSPSQYSNARLISATVRIRF